MAVTSSNNCFEQR